MAAAVADYRPSEALERKQKRGGLEHWPLELERNPDLDRLDRPGGADQGRLRRETDDVLENAARKLETKGAQLIVANDVSAPDAGFAVDTNRIVILDRDGGRDELPLLSKYDCSQRILDRVAALLAGSPSG